jgi:hypothetical protein
MTIGKLKRALEAYPDDFTIYFGCPELQFYRLKQQGEKSVQLEFDQNIYKDEGVWYVDDFEAEKKPPA